MDSIGATFRFSCSYTSSQNGHAERMLRTINNLVRTLLIQAEMPPTFWVEALYTAVHLLNIVPSSAIDHKVPYTTLFNKQARYGHLCTFGCLCYPNLLPSTPHKLAPHSTPCLLLDYPTDHCSYRCLELSTKCVILSRHVTFVETIFPYLATTSSDKISPPHMSLPPAPIPHLSPPQPPLPPAPTPQIQPHSPSLSISPSPSPSPPPPPPKTSTHSMNTRNKSGILKPRNLLCLHTDAIISPLPASHIQAAKNRHWNNAMT